MKRNSVPDRIRLAGMAMFNQMYDRIYSTNDRLVRDTFSTYFNSLDLDALIIHTEITDACNTTSN